MRILAGLACALLASVAPAPSLAQVVLNFSVPAIVTESSFGNPTLPAPPVVGSTFTLTGRAIFFADVTDVEPIPRVGSFVLDADQDGAYDYEIDPVPVTFAWIGFSGSEPFKVAPVFTFLDGKLDRIDFSDFIGDGLFLFDLFSIGTDLSYEYGDFDEEGNELESSYVASLDYASSTFSGYPLAAVPEPGTWLLMIAGFGLIGGGLRRSRRTPVVTQAVT